ncbi:MAG: hypothetical protein R3F29_10755 [Planctomycetota bacterium]
MKRPLSIVLLLALLTACSTLRYDLAPVPFPVSASPGQGGEPFELIGKQVLWVHGLLGEKQPDVAAMLTEHCGDAAGVTDFRVSAGASIWDWLGTHLSLGLVRLKTVKISGRRAAR